jgi:hypothetical protein
MLLCKLRLKVDGTESPLRSTDAKSKRRSSCIIIGARLAGLAAAHYLSRRISQTWQRAGPLGGAYAFDRPGQWFSVRPTLHSALKQ